MKKFLILIVIIALVVSGIIFKNNEDSKKGFQTVYNNQKDEPFSVDIKLPNWDKASFTGTNIHYDTVFIPMDKTLQNTDKKLLITFYSASQNYYPESYYNEYIDSLRKEAKNLNGELNTKLEKASTNEVIFEWNITTKNVVEMCRLYRTQRGLYIVRFAKSGSFFDEKEREEVIKTIRSLKESD